MPSEAPISDSVDPLRGINGLMLFPRTIRAAADVPAPVDARDLESIHNFVRSLELRSPEKLMNEAKRIVDCGTESLDYNLAKFTENVGIPVAVASKGDDQPREQRQGLGLARKRRPFSLKSNTSQPSVCLESTLDISNLEDPDEFFDAYERMEKANKEIQKQMGNMDRIENYIPSNNARRRPRPGILGKTYHFKHQYPSEPLENDRLMLSSETVDQHITGTPRDESHEKLVHLDSIPSADVEEVETTVSTKKTENQVSGLLEELLSSNIEDLEGDGALNLLQERLKIKPLDLENLCTIELPGVRTITFTVTERDLGSTSVPTTTEHLQKHKKGSPDIGSVLKNLSRKFLEEHELMTSTNNSSSSPTPPRSPFALISSLQKKISQPHPLKDQFSATNIDLSAHQNSSPARSKHKLLDPIAPLKDLDLSNELELCMEVDNREPVVSNVDAESEMGVACGVPNQFVDENASATNKDVCRPNEKPDVEKMSVDEVAGKSYPSVLENETCDDTLGRNQTDTEQHPQVPRSKLPKGRKGAGVKRTRKTHIMRGSADKPNPSVHEGVAHDDTSNQKHTDTEQQLEVDKPNPSVHDEAHDDTSNQKHTDTEQQLEVHQSDLLRGRKVAGENRIRKAHPMRKSFAECGTSFETGVRRSKRMKMRPLEYWKGERFLYGRVGESFKLIGVKYIAPGKSSEQLKVKPYNIPETSEFKELLELAARH